MEDLLGKVTPALDFIRGWIMKAAEFLAGLVDLSVENVYIFLIVIISIWLARKVLMFFYSTLEGRFVYWAILAGGIFYILKFLN